MIYSFGASNYFSFKDGFDVSFEFNSKVPKNISKGRKLSTVMGIKGANASGKTSILRSLEYLTAFCTRSFKRAEKDLNLVAPFFENTAPCEFYIDFEANGVRYIYETSITTSAVEKEVLYKKISRKTKIFERKKNEITYRISELEELDLIILRNNASVIDTLNFYKLDLKTPDISNVQSFFNAVRGNVSALTVLDDKDFSSYEDVNKYYHQVPSALEFAKNIIIKCDLGISDIQLYEHTNKQGEIEHFPIFFHSGGSEGTRALSYFAESHGTTALYRRLKTYWATLYWGGTLVMDEFDTNLHPDLLPIIIDLFLNPETNPKSAQFIFTSHNLEVIDHLGKYRTILVGKEDGESFCYRLDEIPGDIIRNDRSISSLYRDGKIGGVPKL
ncbi:ATP-binding protein [Pseudomonas sp. P9_2]|uniref:AAA family ATPase n=1 Tax=Pseudomonas sp. P9_2 TaxID=3043447 RepID=UPI002A35903E|nr:ATP-binding protein [Pseudomonas sp. P9_2]WPN52432.1 ATP-binding protein [Pseudomonas sp. P9_2]